MSRSIGFCILASCSFASAQVKPPVVAKNEPEKFAARDFLGDTIGFIAGRKGLLLMATQKTDIFGRPQNLNIPKPKQTTQQIAAAKPVKPRVQLGPILKRIPITMLDTGSNRVLLESGESLRVGELIEVASNGETIQLRLDAVRRQGAYFRNMENGDLGLATMSGLGEGISLEGGGKPSQGIQRVQRNQPRTIQLGGSSNGEEPPSGLSNRR